MRTTPSGWAADLALWTLLGIGMLTVNPPRSMSFVHGATLATCLVGAAVLGRVYPLAALAPTVFIAQTDARCYAAVALAAFLSGRRSADGPGLPVRVAAVLGPAVLGAWSAHSTVAELAVLPAELLGLAAIPWLIGRYRHQWVALHRRGWEQAARLQRERDLVEERTRLRERARIAQDMHDSLGHDLSLIALRAAAFELDATLTEAQRDRAGELRMGAGAATERLHEIIGVLRESDEPAPVEPVHEDLDTLVARCRASGMVIRHTVESTVGPKTDPKAEPVALPPMVDLALHRIVRESLTNAAKHAPGAVVRITVAHTAHRTTVEIANGPAPRPADAAPAGSGHGLVGMRERARLLGGTLTAAPEADGFRVLAHLPHHAAPARPDTDVNHLEQGRRIRRRFVRALLWTGAGVLLAGSAYALTTRGEAVAPDDFHRMRIGQTRAELDAVLPDDQAERRPEHEPPIPAGAACEYYTNGDILPDRLFRLCFAGGVLVAKDDIPVESRPERDAGR
ncbi:sensor histidine kinase [Embleya sp. NPDC050493]|uniref:sensor histidine kinase n=1 Tax=Embleya sp. NPDC050493 TaxID=3363989 RepID=UPI0037AD5FFA